MTRDATKPALSTEARILVAWLHRHARGAKRAVPYRRLAVVLAGVGCRVDERQIYDLVAELQLAGRPVGSTPRHPHPGAYICETDDDWDAAEANLKRRLYRPLARLRRLRRTRRETADGQTVMALEDEPPILDSRGQGLIFNPSGHDG